MRFRCPRPAGWFYGRPAKDLRRGACLLAGMIILIGYQDPGRLDELLPSQFTGQFRRHNVNMQEQVITLQVKTPPKGNRGWFQPGDRRINREGRPRGSKARAEERGEPAVRAPRADRLKLLVVPARDLAWRLSRQNAPWIVNLPPGFEIVGCAHMAACDAVALLIHSEEFPRIAQGTPIPEFQPTIHGQQWRRKG